MFLTICNASLPTEACRAVVWQVYSPCVPTYKGLSHQGLACLFALCPYLQTPVAPGSGVFIRPVSLPKYACRLGSGIFIRPAIGFVFA